MNPMYCESLLTIGENSSAMFPREWAPITIRRLPCCCCSTELPYRGNDAIVLIDFIMLTAQKKKRKLKFPNLCLKQRSLKQETQLFSWVYCVNMTFLKIRRVDYKYTIFISILFYFPNKNEYFL